MALIDSFNDISKILKKYRNIAVVGLSANQMRISYRVANYMRHQGYNIIPVNPNYDEIFGETCYPSLQEVPEKIEIVNIFRRPEYVLPVVKDAIKTEAKVIWMQLGIINDEAADLAVSEGLDVIMDRCIKVEHQMII